MLKLARVTKVVRKRVKKSDAKKKPIKKSATKKTVTKKAPKKEFDMSKVCPTCGRKG